MAAVRQFKSIQALRALAAMAVVIFHAEGNVATYGWAVHLIHSVSRFGEIGVDVFFIISGFVMALVTHEKPTTVASTKEFVSARLARVVPLYWLLTALFIALLVVVPGAFGNAHLMAWNAIASFLFFPSLNWAHIAAPVLGVGWTLNYEMWFYAVFAIAICTTRYRIPAVAAFFVLTSSLRLMTGGGVVFDFYTSPIVLEFVFGCCVGAWYASGRSIPVTLAVGLLVVVAIASKAFAPPLSDANRFLVYGMPALTFVLVGLSLEHKMRWNSLLERIGDSSYSLYLTHVFSVPIAVKLLQIVDTRHRLPGDLISIVVVVLSVVAGLATYRLIERPVSRAARRVFRFAGRRSTDR